MKGLKQTDPNCQKMLERKDNVANSIGGELYKADDVLRDNTINQQIQMPVVHNYTIWIESNGFLWNRTQLLTCQRLLQPAYQNSQE